MDWTTLYPMLGALLGSFVTGGLMFLAQRTAQRNENIRHTRKLAVDLAVAEWQRHFDRSADYERAGAKVVFRPVEQYFIRYLPTLEILLRENTTGNDIESIIADLNAAIARGDEVLAGLRYRECSVFSSKEPSQPGE